MNDCPRCGSHNLKPLTIYLQNQKGLSDGRNKQIEELRQEIKLLQWQVKARIGVDY